MATPWDETIVSTAMRANGDEQVRRRQTVKLTDVTAAAHWTLPFTVMSVKKNAVKDLDVLFMSICATKI